MTRVCAIAPQMELELQAYESVGLAVQAYELPEIDRKSMENRTKIHPKRSLAASGLSGTIRERFRTSPRGTESASRPPLGALGTARERLGVASGPPRRRLGARRCHVWASRYVCCALLGRLALVWCRSPLRAVSFKRF